MIEIFTVRSHFLLLSQTGTNIKMSLFCLQFCYSLYSPSSNYLDEIRTQSVKFVTSRQTQFYVHHHNFLACNDTLLGYSKTQINDRNAE